jgi:hypothetical protein
MGREASEESFLQGMLGKIRRRPPAEPVAPPNAPLGMLERLQAGEHPDYCLYLRPPAGGATPKTSLISVDLEEQLIKAFDPLPVVGLDEYAGALATSVLPDESFLLLAKRARVLCLVPTADALFVRRLRIIRALGPIGRCIFAMPEEGTLGTVSWPAVWPAACTALLPVGVELSAYTAGGWLFRLDKQGKAVTFRTIVNPNPDKVARALEAICVEIEPGS